MKLLLRKINPITDLYLKLKYTRSFKSPHPQINVKIFKISIYTYGP